MRTTLKVSVPDSSLIASKVTQKAIYQERFNMLETTHSIKRLSYLGLEMKNRFLIFM